MSDPTQLLPQPVLSFLGIFVQICHLLNHFLGYGWGYMAFLGLLAFACVCPGLAYWGNLIKSGMSSEKAAKQSSWVATPLFFCVSADRRLRLLPRWQCSASGVGISVAKQRQNDPGWYITSRDPGIEIGIHPIDAADQHAMKSRNPASSGHLSLASSTARIATSGSPTATLYQAQSSTPAGVSSRIRCSGSSSARIGQPQRARTRHMARMCSDCQWRQVRSSMFMPVDSHRATEKR